MAHGPSEEEGCGYYDILGDLESRSVGWTDWVDRESGPNHVGNFCDAAIIADTSADSESDITVLLHGSLFSKFLAPNSVRVET